MYENLSTDLTPVADDIRAFAELRAGLDRASIPVLSGADLLSTEPPPADQILPGIFDRGDKVVVIGASKSRKTFFLLQALLCLASGRPFLSWAVPEKRRIFHVQYEIQPHHFHRRVKRMARAMGIAADDLGDRFQILNARGLGLSGSSGIETIQQLAVQMQPDIISIDPLYKIATGAENAAEDLKSVLNGFDKLAKMTGAAILYVHHDAKGFAGDRDVRDRGAGSNVLGRDYDAAITLTAHVSEEDAVVVETLLRNYRPQEAFTAVWTEDLETRAYRFDLDAAIVPTKKTSSAVKASVPPFDAYIPAAAELLTEKALPMGIFLDLFRSKTGLSATRARAFKDWATSYDVRRLDTIEKRGRGAHVKMIGLPDQIYRLRMAQEIKNV